MKWACPNRRTTPIDVTFGLPQFPSRRSAHVNLSQQTFPKSALVQVLALAFAAAVTACGGNDDEPVPPASPTLLAGTAATGAALSNAVVQITAGDGSAACSETQIVTSGIGAYSCTLIEGKTAPFLVVVTDPSGGVAPLVSIATAAPPAGQTLVVNATPLTTAILAQLAPDKSALSVIATPSLLDTTKIQAITTQVLDQLSNVLAALQMPAGYNPFTTPITAATATVSGDTADKILEVIKITTVDGQTLIAPADDPTATVPMADATTTTPPKVTAPNAAVLSLSDALRLLAGALTDCFKVPVGTIGQPGSRVLAVAELPASQGGREVTEAAPACDGIAHSQFLQNGYRGGQQFYGLLTDENMTGAVFGVPEVMRFIDDTTAADNDRAIVNLRYVDRNGAAGTVITVAQKFPGTAAPQRNTDWWLHGNQQPIDSNLQAAIRRREQFAPGAGTGTGTFGGSANSRFESGLVLFVNKDGPNSTGMRAVRITGPGLPTAGIVLTRPDPALILSQNWMNIRRKDGLTDTASATASTNVGNIFILQRTQGISGADATTVRPQPNAANTNNTQFPTFAHPLDYGLAPGTANFIDFTTLKAQTIYTFEVFYDGETAPRYSYGKTLLQPVVPSTRGSSLAWIDLSAQTKAYLDPALAQAASTTFVPLSWLANPLAETVGSAGVYTSGGGQAVSQGLVAVQRGATSATATAPNDSQGQQVAFPALTSDGTSSRQFQLRFRMLDGSYKDSQWQYN